MVQPAFGCTQYRKAGRNTQQAFINGITQVEGGWMGLCYESTYGMVHRSVTEWGGGQTKFKFG